MRMHKNGAIVDDDGKLIVRLVYGGKRLNAYLLAALEAAPPEVLSDRDRR